MFYTMLFMQTWNYLTGCVRDNYNQNIYHPLSMDLQEGFLERKFEF